jgi:hypothetical protein
MRLAALRYPGSRREIKAWVHEAGWCRVMKNVENEAGVVPHLSGSPSWSTVFMASAFMGFMNTTL